MGMHQAASALAAYQSQQMQGQMSLQNMMYQQSQLQNAASTYMGLMQYAQLQPLPPIPSDDGSWDLNRAQSWMDEAEPIRARLVFWSCFGPLGRLVARPLADSLDHCTDQIEAYITSANRKKAALAAQ